MKHATVKHAGRSTVVDLVGHGLSCQKGATVQRVNGYYLYEVGAALRPITFIAPGATKLQFRMNLYAAEQWLTSVLSQTLIPLRTSVQKGWELVGVVQRAKEQLEGLAQEELNQPVDFMEGWRVSSASTEFQTLLSAELSLADLYVVGKKGAYNTTELAENGLSLFPAALATKVPAAIPDAKQAARCIAFELPTAAAFHLHLVLERVMRNYYDVVTGGKPHPDTRKLSGYIDAMKNEQVGDKRVFSALSDIAKFHRNPVLHPDDRLDSVEDAVSLLGSIYSAMSQMLKAIPEPVLKLVAEDVEPKAA